ncbi:MAG: hypothetical protein JSS68_14140 [Actinobacteria bacterium]|nr:hypothetical protein [Actinomycetota bacterium]MBS1884331.1 hypothetical protein [Actinomycetota bacterium]
MFDRKLSRRSLLAGGAALAGAAAAAGSSAGADVPAVTGTPEPPERVEPAIIKGVEGGDRLTLQMRDGTIQEMVDPKPREEWLAGEEADVIWFFEEDEWVLFDIQRMYRPLEEAEVTGESRGLLTTSGEEMKLTSETEASQFFEPGRIVARSPSRIGAGDTVIGIGHRDPTGSFLVVDQIGVARS